MDNLTPPTPPEARRITPDCQPEFPCELYGLARDWHYFRTFECDAMTFADYGWTHWRPLPTAPTQPPAPDSETKTLTEYEKALLCISNWDLQYHSLRSAAHSVLNSQRVFSGAQSAVLTERLDKLAEEVGKDKPAWPTPAPLAGGSEPAEPKTQREVDLEIGETTSGNINFNMIGGQSITINKAWAARIRDRLNHLLRDEAASAGCKEGRPVSPASVAEETFGCIDDHPSVRALRKTLRRLNERVHSNYDFNVDPDAMTLEVGRALEGRPVSPATANDTIYGIPEIDGPITIPASVPKLDYTPPVAGKELIIFINSDAEGMGNHANSRESAIQWFASYLDTLSDGDSDDIRIERRDMTKAELDALPEQ